MEVIRKLWLITEVLKSYSHNSLFLFGFIIDKVLLVLYCKVLLYIFEKYSPKDLMEDNEENKI